MNDGDPGLPLGKCWPVTGGLEERPAHLKPYVCEVDRLKKELTQVARDTITLARLSAHPFANPKAPKESSG